SRAKESIPLDRLAERLPGLLDEVQRALFESAMAFRAENSATATSFGELESHFASKRGFVAVPWDGSAAFEARVKEATGATMRCVPLDQTPWAGLARDGESVALFARAY